MSTIMQPPYEHIYPPASLRHQRIQPSKSLLFWLVVGSVTLMGLFVLLLIGAAGVFLYFSQTHIPAGVTVAGVPVGGKSLSEAREILQQQPPHQVITTTDGTKNWTILLSDLGATIDIESTLKAAQKAQKGSTIEPRYLVDMNQTQQGLIFLSGLSNIPAQPGNPPQTGRALDIPVLLERLRVNLTGEIADDVIELPMIEVVPPKQEVVNQSTGVMTVHIVERGQELALIARLYGVDIQELVRLNNLSNPDLLYVGQELTIPAAGIYQPDVSAAPAAPIATGKAIVVSTGDQRIYAYENGQLVRSHLVSTGLPDTPTVLGDFRIYVKYTATDMRGEDYYLPQVPYTMYFYQGYGIHGTYWHNSFGRPMSHGCVNLPTAEAEWFFNWAEVGTLVRVI